MGKQRFSFIGERIKRLRGGQSQSDFSQQIGVPFRTYQRYEAGETVPKRDVLERISKLTGKSVDWIMAGADRAAESGAVYYDATVKKITDLLETMDKTDRENVLKYVEFLREKAKEGLR